MPFRISLSKADVQDALTTQGYTSARAPNLDRLDVAVSTRATVGDAMDLTAGAEAKVRTQADNALAAAGVTSARMAKLDKIAVPVTASGSVTAASNTAGLVVSLDTENRSVVEVRYTASAAASFMMEGSDDNVTWYTAESFSESEPVTDKITGYLNGRRYVRFKSPTTGIDLSFQITALL